VTVWAVTPVVSALYGATYAGWFALAFRVLVIPFTLLGQSISTVVFPETAERHREGLDSGPILTATAHSLLTVSVPVFGVVILLGPEAFAVLFGADWREAGTIAATLAPWMALGLASSSISSYSTVRQRFAKILVIGIVEGTLRMGALALGSAKDDETLGTVLYSLAGAVIAAVWIVWVLQQAGVGIAQIGRTIAPALVSLVTVYFASLLGRRTLTEPVYLAASIAIAGGMLARATSQTRRLVISRS
jgi:O-antigen/teichoic acid export membrane protein